MAGQARPEGAIEVKLGKIGNVFRSLHLRSILARFPDLIKQYYSMNISVNKEYLPISHSAGFSAATQVAPEFSTRNPAPLFELFLVIKTKESRISRVIHQD